MERIFSAQRNPWRTLSVLLLGVHLFADGGLYRSVKAGEGPAAARTQELEQIPYWVEVRTADPALADCPFVVDKILTDPRGWVRARFAFGLDPKAPYRIIIAEGDEVDRLCYPYQTRRTYSCQNGPVVAINADRWRSATPEWTADLDGYRIMRSATCCTCTIPILSAPEPDCPRR
jgi:hypothetical protein